MDFTKNFTIFVILKVTKIFKMIKVSLGCGKTILGNDWQHFDGGEYHIKELGYWVDGYDKENNIVYEYDERQHFNSAGSLCDKDARRQREIAEYLGCKFVRVKETDKIDEILIRIKGILNER